MSRVLLLLAVAGAHGAYYLWPRAGSGRQWAHYVGTHLLLVVALSLLLSWASSARNAALATAGAAACWWGILESGQAVVCSVLRWGSLQQADLCEQVWGHEVYVAAAAMTAAWLITSRLMRARGGHG